MNQNRENINVEKIFNFSENKEKIYYPVKWYVGAVKIGKQNLNLGYCTYGKGIAFIVTDGLTPIIVSDVRVVDGRCSDARYCINLSCPLSNTNIEYLHEFGIKSKEDLEKFYERVEEIEKKLEEMGFSFEKAKPGICLFKKPIIRIENKKS